MLHKVR